MKLFCLIFISLISVSEAYYLPPILTELNPPRETQVLPDFSEKLKERFILLAKKPALTLSEQEEFLVYYQVIFGEGINIGTYKVGSDVERIRK